MATGDRRAGTASSWRFRCASREDVDSRYETLMAAGYTGHRAPWDAFWGQRYASSVTRMEIESACLPHKKIPAVSAGII